MALTLFAVSHTVLLAAQDAAALRREPLARRVRAMAKHAGADFVWERTQPLGPERMHLLRGATLLFPDTPPALLADVHELRRLRSLGVRTVIATHVANPDAFVRLEMRRFSRLRRLLQALWLALHAVAFFAAPGFAWTRFLLVTPYAVEGSRWETPGLRALPHLADTDLCERYALFEGFTQLPPIPVSHADIARLGGGRYSVWHRHVVFSRAAARRRWFMLVRRSRWTAPFLEFSGETVAPLREEETDWVAAVNEVLSSHQASFKGKGFVVLTHCLAPGGAERQWCYLAIGLQRLGHEVWFVATHDVRGAGSHYLPLLQAHGIRFIALDEAEVACAQPAPPELSGANPFGERLPRLAALLARLRPAALFAQLDGPNVMAAVAGHAAGVPRIVLSFRNYNPTHFPYIHQDWMLPCYRALVRSARVVLAGNSQAANRDYAAWIGVPPGRVHTIANAIEAPCGEGVDGARAGMDGARAELGIAPGAPLILGVFRLSEEKRPFDFLAVCREVRQALPALRVLIVGEGPLRERLSRGLEPWIELLGRRTDVARLLAACDLLLLTSSHEGMSNAVMEAQLAGRPVVASRTGALPECVREGESALLVEPGDIAGFARACLRLLADPAAARAMGARGARRMREEFTLDHMARRYLALAQP